MKPTIPKGLRTLLLVALFATALATVGFSAVAAADLVSSDEGVEIHDENDTVHVDVEFIEGDWQDGGNVTETSATVEIRYDDDITISQSETLSVNETDLTEENGSVWRTAEFTEFGETGNYTVSLNADHDGAINTTDVVYTEVTSDGGGTIDLDDEDDVLILGGIAVFVLLAGVFLTMGSGNGGRR